MTLDIETLLKQAHSPIRNFFVPGLTRWTVGGVHERGAVHLFQAAREPLDWITPHSHRFQSQFLILEGKMIHRAWMEHPQGDEFVKTKMRYDTEAQTFRREEPVVGRYRFIKQAYSEGEWGLLEPPDIHSLFFEKDSYALFFEGPHTRVTNEILEPFADGQHIRTFDPQPWMFK